MKKVFIRIVRFMQIAITLCLAVISGFAGYFLFVDSRDTSFSVHPVLSESQGSTPAATGKPIPAWKRIDPQKTARDFFLHHEDVILACEDRDRDALEFSTGILVDWYDFQEAGLDPLLDEMFTFSNKIKMSWQLMTDKQELERSMGQLVRKHLGKPEALGNKLEVAAEELCLELTANNNRLMLDIESAVSVDMKGLGMPEDRIESLVGSYRNHFADALVRDLKLSAESMVATEALTLAVETIIIAPLVKILGKFAVTTAPTIGARFGIQGAILGAGASNAGWTKGISVVLALVAAVATDMIIEKHTREKARKNLLEIITASRKHTLEAFRGRGRDGLDRLHAMRRTALNDSLTDSIVLATAK